MESPTRHQNLKQDQPDALSHLEWLFGPFRLIPSPGELASGGSRISLAQKSLELLVHLVRHRDRVVPWFELRETVWCGTSVSDAAVASVLRDLRRALADSGTRLRFIATVRGRGIRFVHDVVEVPFESEETHITAWEIAAEHFERALEALTLVESGRGQTLGANAAPAPRERGELVVALARARWSAGSTADARVAFLEAARVARQIGDAEVLAQAALGFVGRSDMTPGVNSEAVELLEEALKMLPKRDSALRAELLARMGTELIYDPGTSRSDSLTRDALVMAERLGDSTMVAYTSTARHFCLQRPEIAPAERIALADHAILLTKSAPASDIQAIALHERLIDLFELGAGDAFDETFSRYKQVVERLDQPFFIWLESMFRGTRALLAGNLDEAEQLAHATLSVGARMGTPNAEGAFAGQIFSIRREQGRLAELAPALEAAAARHPAVTVYRAGRAAVAAAAGTPEDANAAIEDVMARDLEDFPRDQNWIATLGTLVPVATAAGNERRIRQLLELLAPYEGRMIIVGQGATTHGAVSHQLGVLHAALGETRRAEARFADAASLHERARTPLWLGHTLRARAALRGTRSPPSSS